MSQTFGQMAQSAGNQALNNIGNNLANNINNSVNNFLGAPGAAPGYGAPAPGVAPGYGAPVPGVAPGYGAPEYATPGVAPGSQMIQDPRGVGNFNRSVLPDGGDPIGRSMQFPYSNRFAQGSSNYMDPKNYDENSIYFPNDTPRDIIILDYGEDMMQVTVSNPYGEPWVRDYSGGNRVRHVVNDYYREMNGRNLPEIYYTNWRCNGAPVRMDEKLRDLASPAAIPEPVPVPEPTYFIPEPVTYIPEVVPTGNPRLTFTQGSNLVPTSGSFVQLGGAPSIDQPGSGQFLNI